MATTTNFGWETPDDTDLVKDGAASIRTLGSAIDTSLVDLKGGTTGQVLSKASNTDMDFTWVAQDDSNAIQNALLTTTGDTIYASSASTPARLGIGSSGQVLTVSGGVPTWATPSSGSFTELASGNLPTNASTVTISSLSTSYRDLRILVRDFHCGAVNSARLNFRVNSDSGSNYYNVTTYPTQTTSDTRISHRFNMAPSTVDNIAQVDLFNYSDSTVAKNWIRQDIGLNTAPSTYGAAISAGGYNSATAITSITIFDFDGNNFAAGNYVILGVK